MTRRVAFSSGHRYWSSSKSADENRALFGKWASPFSHGHNYILDVTVEGSPNPENGMILNIKRLDDILKDKVVRQFDQRSMNDEIPYFAEHAPSLENVLTFIRKELGSLPTEIELVELRLEETPTLWADLTHQNGSWKMTLTRSYEFAASHRLNAPSLSEAQNVDLYGKCFNPAGHGHNYILEVTVEGDIDAKTGMMTDLEALDNTVNELVVDRYDHKNLNQDLPEFEGRITTTEIVVQEIWNRLDGKLAVQLSKVKLWETARNAFEVSRKS